MQRPLLSTLFPYTTLFRSPNLTNIDNACRWVPFGELAEHWHCAASASRDGRWPTRPVENYNALVAIAIGLCCNRMLNYRSEEHTSELQSLRHLVCRLLLEK